MATNHEFSSSSFPRPSSSLSSESQSDFSSVAKAFNFVPINLDTNNYLFWKVQILATVRAFDLMSFINKSPPSVKYIPDPACDESNSLTINPAYTNWIRSDQLLLGWLFSIMDKEVLTQVIHCNSSAEVWLSLENLYS